MHPSAHLLKVAARKSQARIRRDREAAPAHLKPLLTYVEEHLFEPALNVNQLKEACGLPEHAVHRLRSTLDVSPHTYIEDRRLETASRLLRSTRLRVWEIAEMVGYSGIQVFSRAFTRWSGQRPTAFREAAPADPSFLDGGDDDADLSPLTPLRVPFSREEIATIRAEEVWAALEERTPEMQRELIEKLRLRDSAVVEVLCRQSRRQARRDPRRGIHLARLAISAAAAIPGEGRWRIASWAELANSHREAKELQLAAEALATAEAWGAGPLASPGDDEARSRLLAVHALLLRDQERYPEALEVIEETLERARSREDKELYAELLISKATILSRAGNPAGIAVLEEALALDRERRK